MMAMHTFFMYVMDFGLPLNKWMNKRMKFLAIDLYGFLLILF